jgi:hypothetical protein
VCRASISGGLPRSAAVYARGWALAFAWAVLLLVAACGEDSPAGPAQASPIDTTQLVGFLNDPFVSLLTTLLQDQAAATGIRSAFSTLSNVAEHEGIKSIRRSFLSAHRSVERYRAEAEAGAGDPTILEALDLVLLQAELLLDGPLGPDAAVIELH